MNDAAPILIDQDPLDIEIAAKEATAIKLERDLDVVRVEIRTLRRAAELRPAVRNVAPTKRVLYSPPPDFSAQQSSGRGKAPGAISMQWRQIMGKMVANGNSLMAPDLWVLAASECGHEVDVDTARDWLRRAAKSDFGYIERDGDAFRVSQAAIQRFNLKAPEPPPEVTSDGSA